MKKKYIIIIIILLSLLILFFIYNSINSKPKQKNIELNNNVNVIKDQTLENLNITNVSLTISKNKTSTFSADVTNNLDSNDIEYINIIFKDKNGNIITTLLGYVGLELKKGDMTKIYTETNIDLRNVDSVEYERGSIE